MCAGVGVGVGVGVGQRGCVYRPVRGLLGVVVASVLHRLVIPFEFMLVVGTQGAHRPSP